MALEIEFTVQIWKEGAGFVAHAMPLDVMSTGASPQLARGALDEAVRLFLVTAADHGTLEEILEECGYERVGQTWKGPAWVATELHSLALAS